MPSIVQPAIRRLHSLIRSLFVDGLPSARKTGWEAHPANCGLTPSIVQPNHPPSAFVDSFPHSLTVHPPPTGSKRLSAPPPPSILRRAGKSVLQRSAARRLSSAKIKN